MFDLFRSQGKAAKYLLGGMLFLLTMSMLVYLVPQYGTDTVLGNEILLQAGSQKMTSTEAITLFNQSNQGQVPAELMASLFPQWLEGQKQRLAVLEAAQRMGIVTTNDEIAETLAVAPVFANYFQNGKLTDRAGFEAAVAQQGFSVDSIFSMVRDQLNELKLRDALAQSAIVTPKELEQAYKRKYERATVDYILFNEELMRPKVSVTDAEVQKHWEATKAAYTQPEKYGFRVLVLSQDTVQSKLTVTDQELRSAYAAAIDNYTVPEQVHARHILVKADQSASADEKAKARKKAEDLLKQLKGGANFDEVAKQSDDSTVDLGTFGRGGMEKPFEDAAFALKPNELSGIVNTVYGYHIIQVLEKTPTQVKPFEEVRGEIEQYLRTNKMTDAMAATSSQLRDEIKKDLNAASAVAQKFGAQLITVPEAARGTAIPTLGVTPEIEAALGVMEPGGVSDVIPLPGDRAAVAILDKKIPSRPSTFEEARDSVRSSLIVDRARQLVTDLSNKALERLRAGEDPYAVAQSLGVKAEAASSFGLTDTLPDLGPAVYFEEAFRKGPGTVIGPTLMGGNTVVAKVVSKTEADMAGLAAERTSLMLSLRSERAKQSNSLFSDSIVKRLTEEGQLKVNDEELQRVLAQIR